MRKPRIINESGPYTVKSLANGEMLVIPKWPQFLVWDEASGGGPGLVSRLELAQSLEMWLNGGQS